MKLSVGTKSILFGYHQFIWHPLAVARAWKILYGLEEMSDVRLWCAFFLHDIGYIGKSNMDGEEGQTHPELGGKVMEHLFGKEWGDFTRFHSRYYASRAGAKCSRLYVADKLAFLLQPSSLIVLLTSLSGEVYEYIYLMNERELMTISSRWEWVQELKLIWRREVQRLGPSVSGWYWHVR